MIPTYTVPMPLSFWTRQSARLKEEIRVQEKRVMAAAEPLTVSVDAKNDDERRAAATATLREALTRLDSLRALDWTLSDQLTVSCFQAGIQELQSRVAFFEQHSVFYSELVKDRLSRDEAQQNIANKRAAYASASKPQGGEWAATERGLLLTQAVQLPVFSKEDAAQYLTSNQQLRNELDLLQVRLETLLANTTLSLMLSDDVVPVLKELGVALLPAQAQPDAPAANMSDASSPAEA